MAVERLLFLSIGLPSWSTVWAVVIFLLVMAAFYAKRRSIFVEYCNRIPGPPAPWPLIGNAMEFPFNSDDMFRFLIDYLDEWRVKHPILRFWAGPFPIFMIYTAEAAEALLASNKLIDKCREYQYLHPWLNTGLLTSSGPKWHLRRKMLTPAFHFKILEDFIDIFNEQSRVLVQKLVTCPQVTSRQGFNIFPFVARCTLDIICDTAMGRHIDAQSHDNSDYVQAVSTISRIIQTRQARPWLQLELLFNLTQLSRDQKKCLQILHGFTNRVIQERKAEHRAQKANTQPPKDVSDHDTLLTKKPRLAFLDLLINASCDGEFLSDEDIREEVDTFMFEGHDTTAAAVSWCLHLIGSDRRVQDRLSEELYRVFGDSDRPVTMNDLLHLKYLECCIKEALRLYPSVPMLGRTLSQNVTLHGYVLPAGTTVALVSYALHRDPTHFPDPERFDPDRFQPENTRGRHPYCYVPFSAGPRNCIGQKFAMMEEKVVLATVLRHFDFESLDKREEMVLLGELVLRPRDGVNVRLIPKSVSISNDSLTSFII